VGSCSLFAAGERARWSSDGAGILFVMIFMVLLAGVGVVFAWMLFWSFSREGAEEDDRLAGVRTALALLQSIRGPPTSAPTPSGSEAAPSFG
jgi:hypothetical protein